MSTAVPSKQQIETNSVPSRQGLSNWASPFLQSSVGGKYLVAITGLILTGFVVVHMLGNLQVFFGADSINAYADSLKKNALVLWTARSVLLAAFCLHIGMALWLNWKAKQARPIPYAHERNVQASFASRHMVLTGLMILAFTAFHIAHFTLGVVTSAEVADGVYKNYLELRDIGYRPDVFSMMIYGFKNPVVAGLYIVAQVFLFLHLTHGVASMFQTLGLNAPRAQRLIRRIALVIALVVCLGNVGIVAGVWLGERSGVLEPLATSRPGQVQPKSLIAPIPFPGKKQ
jgi:succinate dehydrogenase / fumarate reductase cytochrome b subunit